MTKTAYHTIHETIYKKRKDAGEEGWGTISEKEKMIAKTASILSKIKIHKDSNILEVGCGDAEHLLTICKDKYKPYGIDISETAIGWAKEKAEQRKIKANFQVGSVLTLPYSSDYFDLVIDPLCFHCIIDKDREIFLSEVKRVLKSNGFFLGFTMCNTVPEDLTEFFDKQSRNLIRHGIAGRHIGTEESILQEFKKSGFKIVTSELVKDTTDRESDELIYLLQKSKS